MPILLINFFPLKGILFPNLFYSECRLIKAHLQLEIIVQFLKDVQKLDLFCLLIYNFKLALIKLKYMLS